MLTRILFSPHFVWCCVTVLALFILQREAGWMMRSAEFREPLASFLPSSSAAIVRNQCLVTRRSLVHHNHGNTELILDLRPANERRYYFVTTSLIGWAQTMNRSYGNDEMGCSGRFWLVQWQQPRIEDGFGEAYLLQNKDTWGLFHWQRQRVV